MNKSFRIPAVLVLLGVVWVVVYWATPAPDVQVDRLAKGAPEATEGGGVMVAKPQEPPADGVIGAEAEVAAEVAAEAATQLAFEREQVVATETGAEAVVTSADSGGGEPNVAVDGEAVDGEVIEAAVAPAWQVHVVKRGESLSDIAMRYFGDSSSWTAIARMNGDAIDPKRLRAGQEIKIPDDVGNIQGLVPGQEGVAMPEAKLMIYVVKSGDTLSEIAQSVYGDSALWGLIMEANPGKAGNGGRNIRPGMELIIPPAPAQ